MKKLFLFILLSFFLITLVNADLGTFQQNQCVNIRTILNSSSATINTINYPNSTLAASNIAMTQTGNSFNYTFCKTYPLGTYNYDYNDSNGNVYVNSFTITPTGFLDNLGFYIILTIMIIAFLMFGVFTKVIPLTIVAALCNVAWGIYTALYGFNNFMNLGTQIFSIAIIANGMIWGFQAMIEQLDIL